jgi:hypothetical protein
MLFRIPFAGEGEFFTPDSVLSHCYGALLPLFTTKEATTLRQLCREVKSTVAEFPWEDEKTVIRGSVAAWRACFPRARWANVMEYSRYNNETGRRNSVVDADFVHFVGLRRLNMSYCTSVTDAAFSHLKYIHTLNMTFCTQVTITDAAFAHLKGIHTLEMANCSQHTITDVAFFHLKGIHSLSLWCCTQLTSNVFIFLKGVKVLDLGRCPQLVPTDAIRGVELLGLYGCPRSTKDVVISLGIPFVLDSIPIT